MSITRAFVAATTFVAIAGPAHAWDAHGHRTIAWLAMDVMQSKLPEEVKKGELAFVFSESGRAQVGYESGEPDRYRAINFGALKHENDPDHYIDIEKLEQFGLTLSTVAPLRYEYLRDMAIAKHEHPEKVDPYSERRDMARTQEWPGFLPHAIMEHYGKLISSDRQIRILESLHDPKRADQLTAARANVIFEMGQLAHFVGDAAQPLHTTAHHHGWVGPNPDAFTTANGFHRYIDTTVLGVHHLTYDTLKDQIAALKIDRRIANTMNPWEEVIAHIQRSHDQVRPVYALQKSGDLDREPGKVFITERLADGGAMLGTLYAAAWEASAMKTKDAKEFVSYDEESKATPNPMDAKKPEQAAAPDAGPENPATGGAPKNP
jgi:hypothetical protein